MASWLSAAVAIVGLLVLAGWMYNVPALRTFAGPIVMQTNAAVGLVLCALALLSLGRVHAAITIIPALGAAAIGILTLLQHIAGWNLGIDELFYAERATAAATASPNRMGPNAATSLLLAGIAIVLLARGRAGSIRRAQRFAIAGVFLPLLAIAGYLYGAESFYAAAQVTGIAPHMALTLIALHVAVLAARADAGPMARFVSDGPDGALLRRVAVPITALPLLIGFVFLRGREAELYDRGTAYALFAMALIVVLWMMVWQIARSLGATDRQRRRAEQHRDHLLIRERRARDEAEHANRLKDQFIATLSHELRTPLNVMLGWAHVLETGERKESHARAASIVARNGRLLARLVEDLLDISRATVGQFEIARQPLSINGVARAAVDAMIPVAAEKHIALVSRLEATPDLIEADPERLLQVVSNLLSNAVKFTPPGGNVEVRTISDAAEVVLTVSDSGRGFDAAFAPHVFEPFRQADPSTRRDYGGLGLGLSIAQHLVTLHGGSITAASDGHDRGAIFTVTLPAARSASAVEHAARE